MKIRLAQINPTVGDIDGNTDLIIKTIQSSPEGSIVVFPELSITGYPPQDLLLDAVFIAKVEENLDLIRQNTGMRTVVVGLPRYSGCELYNSAAIISNGNILGYHDKVLLPTYDVFDENRYFKPSSRIEPFKVSLDGKSIVLGIQICEDLWDEEYDHNISETLIEKGAEMIINISASPYRKNIISKRLNLCIDKSSHLKYNFIYCNMVGAQDELVFDGRSFIINSSGEVEAMGSAFNEDIIDFDTESLSSIRSNQKLVKQPEELYMALSLGVGDYFQKSNFSKAVIGLSGGIDSALTAAIATQAIGSDNVIGISMPSKFSSQHSKDDAESLANNLGIKFESIPINEIFNQLLSEMGTFFDETESGLAEENLQARIRGNILMSIANKINALVLNTGNKTELALGYCTMYGDMCGALGVISDLNKIEVYEVSKWINSSSKEGIIPQNSIDKNPSAELREDQYDPFDYNIVSPIVDYIINDMMDKESISKMGYDIKLVEEIQNKIYLSEYKRRQAPPGIKVSEKAFGIGRRFPIINKYREVE
jgi:NAD+ synthase (glutamine-hydrolysing)